MLYFVIRFKDVNKDLIRFNIIFLLSLCVTNDIFSEKLFFY